MYKFRNTKKPRKTRNFQVENVYCLFLECEDLLSHVQLLLEVPFLLLSTWCPGWDVNTLLLLSYPVICYHCSSVWNPSEPDIQWVRLLFPEWPEQTLSLEQSHFILLVVSLKLTLARDTHPKSFFLLERSVSLPLEFISFWLVSQRGNLFEPQTILGL